MTFNVSFLSRVSLGERLQREESSGVVRSTGSTLGEKEITFQVEEVRRIFTTSLPSFQTRKNVLKVIV